MRSHPPPL
uniref:Uncharacterized protein n=1 Tax=Anguilla anguilla TaxID=7936 RepID=A0A0E9XFJ3_ANGAN